MNDVHGAIEVTRNDWKNYEAKDPEERLKILAKHYGEASGESRRFFEGRIIELTIDIDEHPDWFAELGYPCCCRECCSQ